MPDQDDLFVAARALEEGSISREQLLDCLHTMAADWWNGRPGRPLGNILVHRGFLPASHLARILTDMTGGAPVLEEAFPGQGGRLGQLLVRAGVITHAEAQDALRYQARQLEGGQPIPRLGECLVALGYTTPRAIQRALSYQSKSVWVCEQCRLVYNLVNAVPTARYDCPRCRSAMKLDLDSVAVTGETLVQPSAPRDPAAEETLAPLTMDELSPARVQRDRDRALRLRSGGALDDRRLQDALHWQVEIAQFGLYAPLQELFRWVGLADAGASEVVRLGPPAAFEVPGYKINGWLTSGTRTSLFSAQPLYTSGASGLLLLHADLCDNGAAVERFRRNSALLTRLDHPRLLKVYQTGRVSIPGSPPRALHYAVTEYVRGTSLEQRLRLRGKMPPSRALAVTADLSAVLTHLRREGFVHCEMVPEHVLVDERDRGKLIDVGVADVCERSGQADGRIAHDTFMLGLVLKAMLTGAVVPPKDPSATDLKAVKAPPEFLRLLQTMLDPVPDRRAPFAAQLQELRGPEEASVSRRS